ncbi:MAG: SPASM domain-containing protein [Pseudomonadota bacterium]
MNDQSFDEIAVQEARPVNPELEAAARETLGRLSRGRAPARAAEFTVSYYDIKVPLKDGSALLFNSLTRSLILLSVEETAVYDALGSEPFPAQKIHDPLLLRALMAGGHIVGASKDEVGGVQKSYEATRASKNTMVLTIAPTMACNFACGYCFQGLLKPTKKMGREVQDAILTFVKAQEGLKGLSVVWYGGEPLMGRDSIYRLSDSLIAWCDKNRISYSAGIVSNAWFLDAEVASQLHARRVRWVQVTIDGDRDTHNQMRPLTSGKGTYDRIIENIGDTLDNTPMNVSVRVNVGQSNIDRASAMLDEFAERGFAQRGSFYVYFSAIEASTPESGTAFDEKMAKADFNKQVLGLEDKARKLGFAGIQKAPGGFSGMCVAASSNGLVVAGNGDIHKCWETAHDPTKRVGTIFEPESMVDNINKAVWDEWSPFDNPVCRSCKILPMCGGHCAHRFIYGDGTALPCPSWKWNTAEYIFARARDLGVVAADQWLPDQSTITAKQSGERHSPESLKQSQTRVLEKVSAKTGETFDIDALFAGEVEAGGIGSDRNV